MLICQLEVHMISHIDLSKHLIQSYNSYLSGLKPESCRSPSCFFTLSYKAGHESGKHFKTS
jgi:putative component of membrane protein insertase Oxa1/YidC/SpoIIIJ protein YidD